MPDSVNPRSAANVRGHPLHPMLVSAPIICLGGTLITDIVYWCTAQMMWADFSAWLVTAGFILGIVAAILGLIDFLSDPRIRALRAARIHLIGNAVVLVLALFNMLVHSRDGWSSVVPYGLILSLLTVLVLGLTGWMGWTMVYRHGVAVKTPAGVAP